MHEGTRFQEKRKRLLIHSAAMIVPMIAALLLLSRTVFAQNTYVINDGGKRIVYSTYATDPAEILNEAGFTLDENDTYIEQKDNGVSEIIVCRGESGSTSVSATPVPATMQAVETYTENIPYQITYCNDPQLPEGSVKVITKGKDGEVRSTASVSYVNGEEVSRTVLSQRVVTQPVNEVVTVGTGTDDRKLDAVPERPVIGDGYIQLATGEILPYTGSMKVGATAYTCEGWQKLPVTATGTLARVGVIAVDPAVIPYGTRMFVVSNDGEVIYGIATAEDTGDPDFISGNRVDLYFDTLQECVEFGYRECTVYFLGETELEREYSGH